MHPTIKRVGIFIRKRKNGIDETLDELVTFLKAQNIAIYMDESGAKRCQHQEVEVIDYRDFKNHCDLIIALGGDGSLIAAAHIATEQELPLIGINRGHLGFLTDIYPSEVKEKLTQVLNGKYQKERRFLLAANLSHQQAIDSCNVALNEVTLSSATTPHMLTLEINIEQEFVCNQRSDGLIIATPTGSTAYALSGGGPILHPELDAITLVPMFAHSLSARPIVINGDHELRIRLLEHADGAAHVSCDAQHYFELPVGEDLIITKNKKTLTLLHPIDYNYYGALRSKLHWGKRFGKE